MPCQNVANMQLMTPNFCWFNVNFHERVSIYFLKRQLLGQKKVGRDDKNGKNLAWILAYVHAS
jgi:hypothetical protein